MFKRLPEAPGAGEKVYLPFHVKQFFNKKGFIYKIVISTDDFSKLSIPMGNGIQLTKMPPFRM